MSVIYHTEFEQGTPEWAEFRKDKITATGAYKISQGESIQDILAEKKNEKSFNGNTYTERGHILEEEARKLFSDLHPGCHVYQVGAITNAKYPLFACSPDMLVDDNAGGEIKSFTEEHHLDTHKAIDPEIYVQIQFNLFISEREYWWFIQYNPEIEDISQTYFETKVYPDEEIFQKFRDALENNSENPEIESKALEIIDLESQLQSQSEEVKQAIQTYTDTKNRIAELKNWLKTNSQGKIKRIYEDDSGNKLDISIYDTNRVSVLDETLIPEEYTTPIKVTDVYLAPDGEFYRNEPNTKLAGNMYKAGKELPPGFEVKKSRSISIKFNGEIL